MPFLGELSADDSKESVARFLLAQILKTNK